MKLIVLLLKLNLINLQFFDQLFKVFLVWFRIVLMAFIK